MCSPLATMRAEDLIRVLIVGDNLQVQKSLTGFVDSYADMMVVGKAANGLEAIRLSAQLKPDIVVMDIIMSKPGRIFAIEMISRQRPQTRIIAISSYLSESIGQMAMKMGAFAYLFNEDAIDKLIATIRDAYHQNSH